PRHRSGRRGGPPVSATSDRQRKRDLAAEILGRAPGGLELLRQAGEYAADARRSAWDFAVEADDLRAAGLTAGDLRWLVSREHVEHGVETSPPGAGRRRFRQGCGLSFTLRSCFVLTEAGARLFRRAAAGRGRTGATARLSHDSKAPPGTPCWDGERR